MGLYFEDPGLLEAWRRRQGVILGLFYTLTIKYATSTILETKKSFLYTFIVPIFQRWRIYEACYHEGEDKILHNTATENLKKMLEI